MFIQFVEDSYRPRAVSYFQARAGASAPTLPAGGCAFEGRGGGADAGRPPLPSTSSVLTTHLTAWPAEGCGTGVSEVGLTTRQGGRLVSVARVARPPPSFLAWLRSSPLARAVARAYAFPDDGRTVRAHSVRQLLAALPPPPPGAVVRVMGYPRGLESALLRGLPHDTWPVLAPKGVTHVLVALDTRANCPSDERCYPQKTGGEEGEGGEGVGAGDGGDGGGGHPSPPPPLWAALLPPDAVLSCTHDERSRDTAVSPCRATAKLAEALEVAGIVRQRKTAAGGVVEGEAGEEEEEDGGAGAPPSSPLRAAAIDVGAAPGGWTQHLARCGRYATVVAVEPGELDPAVAAIRGVAHVRARAEGAVEAVAAALATAGAPGGLADLLTCDANIPIQTLACVLGPLVPFLRPGAPAVVTLKTFTASRAKDRATAEVGAALAGVGLRPVWGLWLFANTRCERTLVCVKEGV